MLKAVILEFKIALRLVINTFKKNINLTTTSTILVIEKWRKY